MTEQTPSAPAAAPAAPASTPVADWARFETAKPAPPPPAYLSKADIVAMTDHAALTTAMREGRVSWMYKPEALERLSTLLREQPGVAVPTREVAVTRATDLPDPSVLPPTAGEADRMTTLEREAFTRPPGLASDYTVPDDNLRDPQTLEFNASIRNALFAGQVPVPVANMVMQAANRIAQQFATLDPEAAAKLADSRSDVVRDFMKGKWGAEFEPRIKAVKEYLKAAGDKAAAAGQPALRDILTNHTELLDDPGVLEMLWNAARAANSRA